MPTYVDSPYGPIDIEAREAHSTVSNIQVLSPAIKATDEADNPLILFMARDDGAFLAIDTNGRPEWKPYQDVQFDWRYDYKSESWIDSAGASLEISE